MARRFRTARDTATGRLLSAYREGGDERARTRLVELYMPLVEALAHRHDRRGAEHDDLVQAGSIGLLNAIERFDTKRGEEFVAFAVPTVAGEMKRHLRDRGSTVRLPRRLHEAGMRVPAAREQLTAKLGEGAERRRARRRAGRHASGSRPAAVRDREAGRPAGQADSSELDASDVRLALSGAFRTLDETDRKILYLRFVEERSRRDVATELGMSQSALARRADGALAKLRAELEGRAFEEAPAAYRRPRRRPGRRPRSCGSTGSADPPEPGAEPVRSRGGHSGRLMLRMPQSLHADLAERREGGERARRWHPAISSYTDTLAALGRVARGGR